jgi:hypothetical protein
MKSLLRLFGFVRDLELSLQQKEDQVAQLSEALNEATREKLLLSDRLDAALDDKRQLWDMVNTSLTAERDALHMQVNYGFQSKWGTTPYPDAMKLPEGMEAPMTSAILPRREMPSERMARAQKHFVTELRSRHPNGDSQQPQQPA